MGTATPTLSTTASPDTTLGNAVSDAATLSGGYNPSGRIVFRLYGRLDTTCANSPAYSKRVTVSGNGVYGSGNFTPARPGTYRWTASYSGDANNQPTAGACNDPGESVTVSP
jgi:hypothetical protein